MPFFYGETKKGHRIHMGDFVMQQSGKSNWVETFCANEMSSWEEGERPPGSRVSDFCRNCFRTYAWKIMVTQLSRDASNISVVSRVEELLKAELSSNVVVQELWTILEEEKKLLGQVLTPDERVKA